MDYSDHTERYVSRSFELIQDLRISIREKGVFACLHPDAGDLFNVCSDLKRVCWTLYKPDIRLEKHVSG
jgi:DNA ligase-4